MKSKEQEIEMDVGSKTEQMGAGQMVDASTTKSLIHKIMLESKKSVDEDKIVKLDGEDPTIEDRDKPRPPEKQSEDTESPVKKKDTLIQSEESPVKESPVKNGDAHMTQEDEQDETLKAMA